MMTETGHKIVYLIVEKGANGNRQTFWRTAGVAYPCRDGSLNFKLDIHPGLTFNVRDPKSIGERAEIATGNDEGDETGETDESPIKHRRCGGCGHGFTADRDNPLCPHCNPDDADWDDDDSHESDSDGQVFPCDDCRIATDLDEARLLSGGGAVCPKCGNGKYKPCGRCGYFYPKAIGGTHCLKCKGGG